MYDKKVAGLNFGDQNVMMEIFCLLSVEKFLPPPSKLCFHPCPLVCLTISKIM